MTEARSADWGSFHADALLSHTAGYRGTATQELRRAKAEVWRIAGVASQAELIAKYTTQEAVDELLAQIRASRKAATA